MDDMPKRRRAPSKTISQKLRLLKHDLQRLHMSMEALQQERVTLRYREPFLVQMYQTFEFWRQLLQQQLYQQQQHLHVRYDLSTENALYDLMFKVTLADMDQSLVAQLSHTTSITGLDSASQNMPHIAAASGTPQQHGLAQAVAEGPAAAVASSQQQQSICTEQDMFSLARGVLSMQPYPGISQIHTSADVRQLYTSNVDEMCIYLSQLNSCSSSSHNIPTAQQEQQQQQQPEGLQEPSMPHVFVPQLQERQPPLTLCQQQQQQQQCELVAKLQGLLCRYMQLQKTLALTPHRLHIFLDFISGADLRADEQPVVASMQQYKTIAEQLQLSAEQKQRLAASLGIAERLLQPIMQQQKQLSMQHGGQAAASPTAQKLSNTSNAGSTQIQQPTQQSQQPLPQRQQQQQQQYGLLLADDTMELHIDWLQLVARKDVAVRLIFSYFVYGCLSWVQLCKLHVLLMPALPWPGMLVRAIAEMVDQEEQEKERNAVS